MEKQMNIDTPNNPFCDNCEEEHCMISGDETCSMVRKYQLYIKMKRDKEHFCGAYRNLKKRLLSVERHRNRLSCALEDSLKMFSGDGGLANEERIDAWRKTLKENG